MVLLLSPSPLDYPCPHPCALSLWRSEVIKAERLKSQHTEDRPLWCSLQRRESTTSSDLQLCLYLFLSSSENTYWAIVEAVSGRVCFNKKDLLRAPTDTSNVNIYKATAKLLWVITSHFMLLFRPGDKREETQTNQQRNNWFGETATVKFSAYCSSELCEAEL